MGKSGRKHHGKHGSKGSSGSKGSGGSKGSNEERRARKAAGRRSALDRAHLLSFGAALRLLLPGNVMGGPQTGGDAGWPWTF